jgi:flagellar L-ring protein precursor FlgH
MLQKSAVRAALALLLLLSALAGARAQVQPSASLWSDDTGNRYGNRKALRAGDLITVLVMESTQGSNRSSLKTKKESKVDAQGGPGAGSLAFLRLFQLKSDVKDELDGNGQSTLSGSLVAKIAASVTEVRPNGQLVIEGSRLVSVNGQDDRITLHGVARPEDIRADNTILSTNLAEARISYDGKGAVKNAAHRGFLLRVLSWFF